MGALGQLTSLLTANHKPQIHTKCQCKDQPSVTSLTDAVSLLSCAYMSFSQAKLPPGANRILFVKNLNYQITGEDMYDLFGRYGSIRQIRIGNEAKSKGTAFVVFDDVMDVRATQATLFSLLSTDFGFVNRPKTHWNI